jgi:ABC-type multidrug transport system fused ATPase/permease subunit
MNAVWIAALAIIGVAAAVSKAVMGGMIREEAQTRLGRIPFALIKLAGARIPGELRDDLVAEWNAELEFVLTGTDGMPLTRLVRGIRYSAGLLLSAREITDELTRGDVSLVARVVRLGIGIIAAVIGCGGVVSGIALAGYHGYGITASVGQTCMALSWVIGGITAVLGRFTGPRIACISLLACAANVAFYLHQADVVHLIWSALDFCVPLAVVALKLWTRRGDRLWREYQELRDAHATLYPDCAKCFGATAGGPERA